MDNYQSFTKKIIEKYDLKLNNDIKTKWEFNYEKEVKKYKKNFVRGYDLAYYEFTENPWIIGEAAIVLEKSAKNLVRALLQVKKR